MKRNFLILFILAGFFSLFASCEKDEDRAVLMSNPGAPVLSNVSNMVLKRSEAKNEIVIAGTKADFGFQASVKYTLQADLAGAQFKNPIDLGTAVVDTFKFTVNSLNSALIKTLPMDKANSLEFRVKAVTVLASGSGAKPVEVLSTPLAVNVTTYGPPTLAVTGDVNNQGVVSANDDKKYIGWIYTDGTAFTFTNKDDGKKYGGANGTITENGPGIQLEAGAYDVTVDLKTMKYEVKDVTIGVIGDAVGGWSDDTKMKWDFTDKTWNIRIDVKAGGIKFRTHGGWANVNVAYDPAGHDLNNLYQSNSRPGAGDSQNIDDIAPGKYDIKLYLNTTPMKVKFTPVTK